MVAVAHSSHPVTFAVFYETTPGTPPADAAAWAAAEGTTADRMRVIDVNHAPIRQAAVVDPNLKDRIFGKDVPIKGLRNADGSNVVIKLHGTESTTAAASQVTETALMRLLEHTFGGLSRGYSSAITSVVSDTSFTLTTTTDADPGNFYALEDDSDTGRLFPVRVLTAAAGAITVDLDVPWTVDTSDVAHACAVLYIDDQALMNPSDASATTTSLLVQRANALWQAAGCKFQVDSIEFPRGDVPRMTFSVFAAYAQPYGDGAPSAPTWTGTITGAAGLVVGADTKVYIEDKATASANFIDVISATVTPGIPVVPQDTITEITNNMQGRAGYGTQPGDTIIEIQVYLSTDWQDDWDTTQAKIIRVFQVAPAGSGWFAHASEAYLMEPPEYAVSNEAGVYTLRYICHEDRSLDSTATNVDRARSKLCVGMY